MKLVSPNQVIEQRKTAEEALRQVLHPHRIMKDKDLFLCWIQRLARARRMVDGKGPKAQKLFDDLADAFDVHCRRADEALTAYEEMCKAASIEPDYVQVRECWCVGCKNEL